MSLALLLRDLLALVVQGVLVTAAAAALARALPIERPALELVWWRTVLVATLVLPFLGVSAPMATDRIQIRLGTLDVISTSAALLGKSIWPEIVATTLALGLAARALRIIHGAFRLRACRLRSLPYSEPLRGLEERVGVRAEVRLSPDVSVPATFGLRRPVVLLPMHIKDMDGDRQRAIVAHELIHVQRRDWPQAVAEEIVAAGLWFHPGVHFLLGRLRLAREQCVDLAVVEVLGERQVYLESLLAVAHRRLPGEPTPAALFLGEHHLAERVEFLLKEVVMSKTRALNHLSLWALVLTVAALAASASFPLLAMAESSEKKTPAARKEAALGEPRRVYKVDPVYPPEAKKDHIQGLVHIDARLAKDGSVAEATATDGAPILAEASLVAVRQWRYEPVLGADQKPVEATLTITINFRLAD